MAFSLAARTVPLTCALVGISTGLLHAQSPGPGAARDLASPAIHQAWSGADSTGLTLTEALAEAVTHAPELAARRARLDAAQARTVGAGAWMPPMIGLMADNVPAGNLDPTTADMGIRVMVSQTVPWPGKLRPGVEAARSGARADEAALEAARLALAAEVVVSYVRLTLVQREREILDEQRRLLQELADLAVRRYAVGAASQAEALRAGLERSRIDVEALALRASHAEATRALRVLMARPATGTDTLIAAAPLTLLVEQLEEVYARATSAGPDRWRQRPEFHAIGARQDAARARLEAVARSRRPDLTVNASYSFVRNGFGMDEMGMDMWGAGVSITVPIAPWSDRAIQADRQFWQAEAHALSEEARALEQRFAAEAAALAEQVRVARDAAHLYAHNLIPQAQTAYDAAHRAYATGTGDLSGLLDAQRSLTELLRAAEIARARYAETLARAVQSTGTDLFLASTR